MKRVEKKVEITGVFRGAVTLSNNYTRATVELPIKELFMELEAQGIKIEKRYILEL